MKILLALPSYNGEGNQLAMMRVGAAKERIKSATIDVFSQASSALTYNFNTMWCRALNENYTHFAMLHADILPHDGKWLGDLLMAMQGKNADMISAVVPLKMDTGQTSTALGVGKEFGNHRRLTMHEAFQLPATFNCADVCNLFGVSPDEKYLLTNTGLMLINLRKREVLSEMVFSVGNWIKRDKQGKYYAVFEPEDWNFSKQAQMRGLSVYATRAVTCTHFGTKEYSSAEAFGTLEHDAVDVL